MILITVFQGDKRLRQFTVAATNIVEFAGLVREEAFASGIDVDADIYEGGASIMWGENFQVGIIPVNPDYSDAAGLSEVASILVEKGVTDAQ